ncbi:MAG TPA: chemotaxis protein CheW [Dehalococcoidia bacterium]
MVAQAVQTASEPAQEAGEERQLVILKVGEESYGIPIGAVQEIIRMQRVTPVPGAAASGIEGILNLRGRIIPVMDLRKALGQIPEDHPDRCITVVEQEGTTLGLIVDGVTEVLRVDQRSVEPPPAMVSTGAGYVNGIIKLEDRLVTELDLGALLSAFGVV